MLNKLYLHIWIRICFVQAYLALQRGDKIEAAEWENQMVRYESELQRLEVLS